MNEQIKEDIKTMQVIRDALDRGDDIDIRKDKNGAINIMTCKRKRLRVQPKTE